MNIASSTRNVLLPFVIKNDLHASARALGFVYSAASAGALISAFAYGQRGVPRRPIVVAYLGWALSLFMIAAYGLGRPSRSSSCSASSAGSASRSGRRSGER
jgi:cyanate permease